MSVLLVGEDNPLSDDPEYALFPYPKNSAGHRLQQILGLRKVTYLKLSRVNLCSGGWDAIDARIKANELRLAPDYSTIATLGRKVATAFSLYGTFFNVIPEEGTTFVMLPHPSGLSRVWNDPTAPLRVRVIMRDLEPEIPWGELYE